MDDETVVSRFLDPARQDLAEVITKRGFECSRGVDSIHEHRFGAIHAATLSDLSAVRHAN